MQSVFAAHDVLTDRLVALKSPLPGQGAKRFRDSAVIAARINHHNVAKTIDYVEENETQYLVEELVDGPNLEEAVGDKYLDPHEAARLLRSLTLGIAASHAAGVVHRDLKPSNVIAEGGRLLSTVKITDFGIATLASSVFEEAAKGDITRSTSGTVRGALPYMAPEMMFRKKGEHPQAPADIWSVGAMMFKLLTGKYPFGVGFEAAANVKTNDREAWPGFMIRNIQFRDLALELQGIVDLCLRHDATERPTATDLIKRCSELCFADAPRLFGTVADRRGSLGFITSDEGKRVFYHADNIYGSPSPQLGDRVIFAPYPGRPWPRAYPVCRS